MGHRTSPLIIILYADWSLGLMVYSKCESNAAALISERVDTGILERCFFFRSFINALVNVARGKQGPVFVSLSLELPFFTSLYCLTL